MNEIAKYAAATKEDLEQYNISSGARIATNATVDGFPAIIIRDPRADGTTVFYVTWSSRPDNDRLRERYRSVLIATANDFGSQFDYSAATSIAVLLSAELVDAGFDYHS